MRKIISVALSVVLMFTMVVYSKTEVNAYQCNKDVSYTYSGVII